MFIFTFGCEGVFDPRKIKNATFFSNHEYTLQGIKRQDKIFYHLQI